MLRQIAPSEVKAVETSQTQPNKLNKVESSEINIVKVHSLDFDGMLAEENYAAQLREMVLSAGNAPLTADDYAKLAKHMLQVHQDFFDKKFAKRTSCRHILMVGSNRQCASMDNLNAIKDQLSMLSCFPFFEALKDEIQSKYNLSIELDKTTLEDMCRSDDDKRTTFDQQCNVYRGLAAYPVIRKMQYFFCSDNHEVRNKIKNEILSYLEEKGSSSDRAEIEKYSRDSHKILLIYMQIHYVNKIYSTHGQYGKKQIEFYFSDDKDSILDKIQKALRKDVSCIPSNVSVILEHYLPECYKQSLRKRSEDPNYEPPHFMPEKTWRGTGVANASIVHHREMILHCLGTCEEGIQSFEQIKNAEQMQLSKSAAVEEIQNIINLLEANVGHKAKGMVAMNKIMESFQQKKINSHECLTKLKNTAVLRLGKSHITTKDANASKPTLFGKFKANAIQACKRYMRN